MWIESEFFNKLFLVDTASLNGNEITIIMIILMISKLKALAKQI